jgi:hypothetical protein
MAKIGRNDPCPCGSGKKYKKCCLPKEELARNTRSRQSITEKAPPSISPNIRSTIDQNTRDNLTREKKTSLFSRFATQSITKDEVDLMDSQVIMQRLRCLGIPFKRDAFTSLVSKCFTIDDVVEAWEKIYVFNTEGQNDDFIFLAAWVLWDRIAPQTPNAEKIEELIEKAYDRELVPRCEQWLDAWKLLKDRSPSRVKSIQDVYPGGWIDLETWCIDLVTDLLDAAGEGHPRFYKHRLRFCKEFLARYPESRTHVLEAMNLGLVESYFRVGNEVEGDRAFQALTTKDPGNARLFMRWGDMYWFDIVPGEAHESKGRARELYQIAIRTDSQKHLKDELDERFAEMEDE